MTRSCWDIDTHVRDFIEKRPLKGGLFYGAASHFPTTSDFCFIIGNMSISDRKNNHIEVCLREDVRSRVSNGFEKYRLIHNALPESDFDAFQIGTTFLGKPIAAPFLISSMTGGTEYGERINRALVGAAAELRLPFAIGSQRVYLESSGKELLSLRKAAEGIPMLANLGAVQLNYGYTRDHCLRAVEMLGADALILHLNPLQELIQTGGNVNFFGLLKKIEALCADFPVPVIVKEVGWGICAETARKLTDAGAAMIDVAGAGGTSWSEVESRVSGSDRVRKIAAPFADWGIPTAECLASIHEQYPEIRLIASGGILNGVDAAKAVMLGAGLCGMAGRLLQSAAEGDADTVAEEIRLIIAQYKIARFLSCGIEKMN